MCPLFNTHYGFARLIASLDDVEADAVCLGILTDEECSCWRVDLEQAEADGMFFASLGMVLVAGCNQK